MLAEFVHVYSLALECHGVVLGFPEVGVFLVCMVAALLGPGQSSHQQLGVRAAPSSEYDFIKANEKCPEMTRRR